MGKLSKLMKSPSLFFSDALSNITKQEKAVPVKVNKKAIPVKVNKKTQEAYLNELVNFIDNFDVNNLKRKTEYLWPYLRHHIWVQLYALGFKNNSNFYRLVPHRLQLGTNINLPYNLRNKFKNIYNAIEIDEIKNANIDFLFFTVVNATEQVTLDNGEIYYRITDPFYEIAAKVGTTKKIEMIKINSPGLKKIRKYKYKPILILSPNKYTKGYSEEILFHYKFMDILKARIPSLKFNMEDIRDTIDWELHTREYYIEILQKLNPKVIFLNGYHYNAPLISAAHFLGIKSVDIQHGIQVGWNPLYNSWAELPIEGYQSLPDYFAVWGKKEYDNIKNTFISKKHQPLIVGNPWPKRELEITKGLTKKAKGKIAKYKYKVIIALQNQDTIPTMLKELIHYASDEFIWIVRHHPKGKKFIIKDFILSDTLDMDWSTESSLECDNQYVCKNINIKKNVKLNKKNFLIGKEIDSMPLSHLFNCTNIVVSAGSTVSIESDYMGLINFIFSLEGKKNYIEEIENSDFIFLDKYIDFFDYLMDIDIENYDRSSKLNTYMDVDLTNVFKGLLQKKPYT